QCATAMRLHLPLPFVGSPIALGELIGTTSGAWITHPPTRCPNGHDFGAGRGLVCYQACLGHGGGHPTWTCRARDTRCTGQPLNTHCTALEGPAVVRISTTDTPLLLIAQIHLGVSPCLGPAFLVRFRTQAVASVTDPGVRRRVDN